MRALVFILCSMLAAATQAAERPNIVFMLSDGKMPDQVKRLTKEPDQSLAQNKAQFPTPNPDYDPTKPAAPRKSGGGKKKPPRSP